MVCILRLWALVISERKLSNMFDIEEDRNDIVSGSQNGSNTDNSKDENKSENDNNFEMSADDVSDSSSEKEIEYVYGISYSSSRSETNENNENKNDSRGHSASGTKAIKTKRIVLVASALAFAILLNFVSAFIGATLVQKKYEQGDGKGSGNYTGTRPTVNFNQSKVDISKLENIEDSASDRALAKKDVYALVSESVVEIKTETVVSGSMIGQYVTSGAGSGVIVGVTENTKDYYIITNDHVVSGASKVTVRLTDGTEYNAKIVSTDSESDIAVIMITADKELKCAVFGNSDSLVVGEDVIAIGNPLGELGGSLTDGIISALERNVVIGGTPMKLLQTNVAVNPGNSGGGLFNMAGELVGIVNAKYSDYDIEGLAFAIPSNTAKSVMAELIEYGYVKGRPDLGITASERTKTYFGMVAETYVVVTDPGNNSDIRVNDQIYKVGDTEISTISNIKSALIGKSVGDKVNVIIYRNKSFIEVEITLVEYVPTDYSIEFKPDI